jgi:carbohydrate diacid regulator
MMIAPSDFSRVAVAITTRASEILQASIGVTDERGQLIAQSDDDLLLAEAIRVPLHGDRRGGEVLVAPYSRAKDPIPPHLAQALVDLVVSEVSISDRLPAQSELKNRFIYDLLRGEAGDQEAVVRDARLLGMDLTPPRAVILVDASGFVGDGPGASRRAQTVISSIVGFFQLPNDTICAWDGEGEIAILKASDTRNLAHWVDRDGDPGPASPSWANLAALKRAARALLARLRQDTGDDLAIGIGRYHPGIPGLAASYRDAHAALALGRRIHGHNRILCLDGLGVAAFVGLADEQTKLDLARHLLSPLDDEPDLLQTLDIFFAEDCCPSRTARSLGIHRNTLGYRFTKVAARTGLDPRHFDDAVQVRLALLLRELAGPMIRP